MPFRPTSVSRFSATLFSLFFATALVLLTVTGAQSEMQQQRDLAAELRDQARSAYHADDNETALVLVDRLVEEYGISDDEQVVSSVCAGLVLKFNIRVMQRDLDGMVIAIEGIDSLAMPCPGDAAADSISRARSIVVLRFMLAREYERALALARSYAGALRDSEIKTVRDRYLGLTLFQAQALAMLGRPSEAVQVFDQVLAETSGEDSDDIQKFRDNVTKLRADLVRQFDL